MMQVKLDFQPLSVMLTCGGGKNLVLDLILALQTLTAARILPSRISDRTLSADLAMLFIRVDSNQFDIKSAVHLVEQVVDHASDTDIWSAVFALVALTTPKPTTPPTVFHKAAFDTPLKSTTSSLQGSEQIHDVLDQCLVQEIDGCVYEDTKGFYGKYFEGKTWSEDAEQIARDANPQIIDGKWSDYPNDTSQGAFLEWFWGF